MYQTTRLLSHSCSCRYKSEQQVYAAQVCSTCQLGRETRSYQYSASTHCVPNKAQILNWNWNLKPQNYSIPYQCLPKLQEMSLTSGCVVHSNVYSLVNIHWTRYLTAVDPFLSTFSTVQTYHHLTSVSEQIWTVIIAGNSSFIWKKPVP